MVNSVFKRASSLSLWVKTVFQGGHKQERRSVQPLLARHDSLECSIWYHTGWNLCSRWRAVSPSDTDQGSVWASEARCRDSKVKGGEAEMTGGPALHTHRRISPTSSQSHEAPAQHSTLMAEVSPRGSDCCRGPGTRT